MGPVVTSLAPPGIPIAPTPHHRSAPPLQVLGGPYYFTVIAELNAELAHIDAIAATKAQAGVLFSHLALAGLVGTANFLGRLAYDASNLEEDM